MSCFGYVVGFVSSFSFIVLGVFYGILGGVVFLFGICCFFSFEFLFFGWFFRKLFFSWFRFFRVLVGFRVVLLECGGGFYLNVWFGVCKDMDIGGLVFRLRGCVEVVGEVGMEVLLFLFWVDFCAFFYR